MSGQWNNDPKPEDLQGVVVEGSGQETGEKFLRAILAGMQKRDLRIKVGFGMGQASMTDGDIKLVPIVASVVNEQIFAFELEDARALARCLENSLSLSPDEHTTEMVTDVIMSLRKSADEAANLDMGKLKGKLN